MVIPAHSLLRIQSLDSKDDLFPVENVKMIVEDEVMLPATSTFKRLYQTPDNALFDLMGMASVVGDTFEKNNPDAEGFTKFLRGLGKGAKQLGGKYKEFGFQLYKDTEPLSLKLTVSLNATWNAKEQVYNPIIKLMTIPLPTTANEQKQNKLLQEGIYNIKSFDKADTQPVKKDGEKEKETMFSALIPPGPNPTLIFSDDADNQTGRTFVIQVGDMVFSNIFFEGVTPTFSKEKMLVNNKYYPMSAKVQLDMKSTFLMTKKMVIDMYGGV